MTQTTKRIGMARQGEGARRSWMSQRFVEIDKAIAASLSIIAERIRTRRWRQSERADVLQDVENVFLNLQRWTAKATQYCENTASIAAAER